jgi:LCP family protein required for cell wall assembly
MADPPKDDRPQYKVYRAGSDAPPRETAPPPGQAPQEPPQQPPQQAPAPGAQPPPQQPGQPSGPAPQYRTYRSRKRLSDRIFPGGVPSLRRRRGGGDDPQRPPALRPPRSRAAIVKRVAKIVLAAMGAWLLLSLVLFFVSAQTQSGVSPEAKDALAPGGSLFTGSTILVLGSDARPAGSKEPGAGGASRSDSIMLMHVGLGSVRKLSIPRDAVADIPGHGRGKINSAYALGGPALAIDTVEGYLGNGVRINHIIEVNFENFPKFIDAIGGIDVTLKKCVSSPPFGEYGTKGGRARLRFHKGKNHLSGAEALGFSRIRKNSCDPTEDDRDRAARQQMVVSAIRSQALSPTTFVRAPWVSWEAPRTVRSDMKGIGLSALFLDLMTGGGGKTNVLEPDTLEPLIVSDAERRTEARKLLGKD